MEDKVIYCLGFLFSPGFGNVALIEKKKPLWQEGKLNGLGGIVSPNESPLEAMKFKFYEESGVQIDSWQQFCLLEGNGFLVHCYYAESQNIIHITQQTGTKGTERPDLYSCISVFEGFRRTVDNVPWLMSMAISVARNQCRAYEFKVTESARRDVQ